MKPRFRVAQIGPLPDLSARRLLPLVLAAIIGLSAGCSKETLNGSDAPGGQQPPPAGPDPNSGLNVRQKAADAHSYAITYGALEPEVIKTLKTYPLVIVHPYNGNITRDQIMRVKEGVKPDDPSDNAVVLCYISIGEDSRTFELNDAQMKADPRFAGDGSGPVIDPRGAGAGGKSLKGIHPKGTPTHRGFASYYLNDNAVNCKGAPDGSPDINPYFKARFVNAGDPAWYQVVHDMTMNSANHTPPGLKEMLTDSYGRSLGCDGVFLDTIDTAAPNDYTEYKDICSDSVNHTNSEWTAQGFTNFIKQLRADYPDKVILQNRGLFFFDPRFPHYEVSARGSIDIGYFESYYLDNDKNVNDDLRFNIDPDTGKSDRYASKYHRDNKYMVAPKIMAEANRPDGFKMLSLGYANGFDAPKPGIDIRTLLEQSVLGLDTLSKDLQLAQKAGFVPYITSAAVDFVNSFAKNNMQTVDTDPPVWSSTYNVNFETVICDKHPCPCGEPPCQVDLPLPPTPRVGIQKAQKSGPGSVTLSWDVALDMNRVHYVLHYQSTETPFSFATAIRQILMPSVGDGYNQVWNTPVPSQALNSVYPYQQTISGLQTGRTYRFVIRAVDSVGNEDGNTNFIEVAL